MCMEVDAASRNGHLAGTRVRLETADGAFVVELKIPPFDPTPSIICWGSRFFRRVLDPDRPEWLRLYREGFCWVAPPGCEIGEETT
jgi:hypothetical protein